MQIVASQFVVFMNITNPQPHRSLISGFKVNIGNEELIRLNQEIRAYIYSE
jgi:hypothetical protein